MVYTVFSWFQLVANKLMSGLYIGCGLVCIVYSTKLPSVGTSQSAPQVQRRPYLNVYTWPSVSALVHIATPPTHFAPASSLRER